MNQVTEQALLNCGWVRIRETISYGCTRYERQVGGKTEVILYDKTLKRIVSYQPAKED